MKTPIKILFALLLISSFYSCKPKKVSIGKGMINFNIEHKFGNNLLEVDPNKFYKNAADNTFNTSLLKYYLSNFILTNDKGEEVKLNNYELIDMSKSSSLSFKYDNILNGKFNKLKFCVGVDSVANSTGDHTGALDPSNGMDWGWNFGYRFFMFEGQYKKNDTTAATSYTYHIGTNANLITVELPIDFELVDNSKSITMVLDIEKVLNTPNRWDFSKNDYNHSSNAQEVKDIKPFIENLKSSFSINSVK